MLTAYATALPPSALPGVQGSVVLVSGDVLLAIAVGALAVLAGAIVQRASAARRRRPILRVIGAPAGGARPLHAA